MLRDSKYNGYVNMTFMVIPYMSEGGVVFDMFSHICLHS